MIKGMTGYGSAQLSTKEAKALIEIKSLNGRYLDIIYYLPAGYVSFEDKIRQHCEQYLERGRVSISLKVTQKKKEEVVLNKEAVQSYLRHAKELRKQFRIKNDLTVADIIKLPGVFEVRETTVNAERLWPGIERGLKKALGALDQMRRREGLSLQRDIKGQLQKMMKEIYVIQTRSRAVLKEMKQSMAAEEFQAYQRGSDTNEELSRLKHHMVEMKRLLNGTSSVGKRIDFIAQEMQRETNTIGAKLQDRIVSNAVIALKSGIEKIREQAQNIE
ncbi:MAG TPA: YicC/YloC family endoribonuclease [Candidatus Omnitrophota bacterium]|nr:YicC/YloC family endoribonuclease [Candidatus Omnitrophota bacterium]